MPKRFVSWAAVSSLPQAKKISLADQLKTNREHIERHGGELVAELVVPGESRSIILFEDAARKMDAYAQLKELIDRRAFDVLVFLDRSRLGRKASLSMAVVELCHDAGIITYETENPPTALDRAQNGHDDMLLGAIKSVGAQREIQKIQERHRMGMIGRIKRGKLPAAAPFGYTERYKEDGEKIVEIDEDAARWVRQIMEWYLAGEGAVSISHRLNDAGRLSPTGKQWTGVLVRSIVRRAWRYAGYGEINRRSKDRPYFRAKGNWPAIIDEKTVERIIAEREARVKNRRLPNTSYLLSGLAWCAVCRRPMRINTMYRDRPTRRLQMQLRCPHGDHKNREASYPRVLKALRSALEGLSEMDLDLLPIDDSAEQAAALEARISECEAAIGRLQTAMHRADDAFVAGTMDAERYQRQVDRLNIQMEQERGEIQRLRNQQTEEAERGSRRERMEDLIAHGLEMLDSEDVTAANAWLRTRVRIWVEKHQVVEVEWL